MPITQDQLLTIQEVARFYHIAVRTARRWLSEGRLPKPIKLNQRVVRWRASDIQRHIENLKS